MPRHATPCFIPLCLALLVSLHIRFSVLPPSTPYHFSLLPLHLATATNCNIPSSRMFYLCSIRSAPFLRSYSVSIVVQHAKVEVNDRSWPWWWWWWCCAPKAGRTIFTCWRTPIDSKKIARWLACRVCCRWRYRSGPSLYVFWRSAARSDGSLSIVQATHGRSSRRCRASPKPPTPQTPPTTPPT